MTKKIMWLAEIGYRPAPKRYEVASETKCFVTVIAIHRGEQYQRRMSKDNFYDTFDAAKEAMIKRVKWRVSAAQSELDAAKAELKRVNDLRRPGGENGNWQE